MIDLCSVSSKKGKDRRRNSFHLVFVPKYRFNMFRSSFVKQVTLEFFKGIGNKYGFVFHTLEIVSNHVHMFVDIPVKISLWNAIRLLKSLSAKCLFKAFPGFRKRYPRGRFWSGYTYYESIGKVTASKIEKYIRESQTKHEQQNNAWQARNAGGSTAR
jgi:putative transposase